MVLRFLEPTAIADFVKLSHYRVKYSSRICDVTAEHGRVAGTLRIVGHSDDSRGAGYYLGIFVSAERPSCNCQ